MNRSKFRQLVCQLYATVAEFEKMFPDRPFTPDGHMVGSLGECLVAYAYSLILENPSNRGFDAKTCDGRKIEIKTTQGRQVAFRSEPEHCIVIKLHKDGSFCEIYNGPGQLVWNHFAGRRMPKNGQYPIRLTALDKLQLEVHDSERIMRRY